MENTETEFTLTIKGFKTKEQALEFAKWYEGQGEQDAAYWFEERKEEGKIDIDFMPVDVWKMRDQWKNFENNNLDLFLKI
jgi:hypothetical protein